ncbi:hypothetical protein COCON_G00195100 [Conger conger]|uniref:Cytochrome P450 n=1 Tax=Conger conger TaxID=82655 RepID=A0A9Q1HP54_CONCO|nr:hypothetical protein COCON_G00195100 [Conger conger]
MRMYAAGMSAVSALKPALRPARFCRWYGLTSPRFKSGASELNLPAGSSSSVTLRTIDDLPGPSLATTIYWLFVKGYADKSHAMQVEHRRLYGPIWRSRFGPFDVVNVATSELIAQVTQQEGRYPVRTLLPHWKEYRDLRGQDYGLHVHTGPDWYRIRSALNPRMLKLQEVSEYAPVVHHVVTDLLRRVERLRLRSPDQATVCDFTAELYKFGFEGRLPWGWPRPGQDRTANAQVSSILFETRLGCLEDDVPPDTQRFIAAVNEMFTMSEIVVLFPRWTRRVLPFWDRFVRAWDDLTGVAQRLVDKRVEEITGKLKQGEQVKGMYLTYLLSSNKLSLEELYTSITELLLGGVDTTSNTLSWTLYHLAQDEAIQKRLHQEVTSVCPGEQLPTTEHLSRMPLLKAVIKEILRLYPVVPGNARYIADNEAIIGNYWFPKKTLFHLCHYATSHDDAQFPEPERFLPDRWLRGSPARSQHHPFSSIPFGVGVRACVGKRVAELEMHFALTRLIRQYQFLPEDNAVPIEPKTRTLMIPSKPVNLRCLPRA